MSIENGGEAAEGREFPREAEFPGTPEWGAGYGADPGSEPTARFDTFWARRRDERAEQETQGAYIFPPEYTVSPGTAFVSPQPLPTPPGSSDRGTRTRSALIFAGAAASVCVLGLGAWLALGSSGSSADASSTGAGATALPTSAATGNAAGDAKHALTFRVTIKSLSTDSFSGTALANGDPITVTIDANTRFGTKAHALSFGTLSVGETVIVRGRRTGADAVTATEVAANVATQNPSAGATNAAA
jgi:hypothetical protein